MSSNGWRNACPSAEATSSPASPSRWRWAMWLSMSTSTSLSSSIFGFAKTANPTLRSASTQGRTTSALPGAILVKTVASGSMETSSRPADRSAVRASSQRPRASNRGRCAAVGRPPRMEPRPMSRFGASQTSRTRDVLGDTSCVSTISSARVMPRLPLAPVLASLRSSLALAFGCSWSALLPEQLGDGAVRIVRLRLVFGDGARHGDRQCLDAVRCDAAQPGFCVADLGDLLGVPGMVGGGVQDTALPQPVGDQRDGAGLQQPAFVMAGLGPWVGEEHPNAGQRLGP